MFLFFDVETTGLPLDRNAAVTAVDNWPRMVQIAWLLFDESENLLASRDDVVKPEGYTIPARAARFHGITTKRACAEGVALEVVLSEVAAAIEQADYLIAHNMGFDEKIVGAEFVRKGIDSRLFQKPRICTMKSSTDYCMIPARRGFKYPNLAELHSKLFKEDFVESHNAVNDVAACAKCFFELRRLGIVRL